MSALPVHVSAVTVDGTVDGRRRRRAPVAGRRSSPVDHVVVDPRIMTAVKAALRPGERLVIVGPGEVRTTYR